MNIAQEILVESENIPAQLLSLFSHVARISIDMINFFKHTVVPRPLSNDPRFTQCIYRYSRAS